MSTTLRGNGSYKKELLFDLYSSFGFQQFKVEQVKSIPSYSQSTFSSLFYDGWLHKTNKNSPCTWRLSNRIESIIKNTNTELHGDVSLTRVKHHLLRQGDKNSPDEKINPTYEDIWLIL